MSTDLQGRCYLHYSELRAGMQVEHDGGSDCWLPAPCDVYEDAHGFYIDCREGRHYLDGQEDEHGYIGNGWYIEAELK